MSHKKQGRRQEVEDAESGETDAAGSQEKFIQVIQQLLEHQQRELQQERVKWAEREEAVKRMADEERAKWAEREEAEKRRADEERALRKEELQLQIEALKRSEEAALRTQAAAADREERRRLQKRADKLEPWRDSDLPEAYLRKFETTMREATIPETEWPSRLISALTGKALTAFHNSVPQSATNSYSELKEAMLEAMGLSLDKCRKTFWSFTKRTGETPQEAMRRVEAAYDRMVRKCKTETDFRWEMVSGRYLSTYTPEVADYVRIRQPKTTIEIANLVQQYYDAKPVWRDQRQFRRPFERSGPREDGERVDRKQGEQHERSSGQSKGGQGNQNVAKGKEEKESVGAPKCFICGKRGHKKFECPNKVARVTSPGRTGSPKVQGRVGNVECELTIDSGALVTMVRADLVQEEDYTGERVTLRSVCGRSFSARTAKVWLHFGDYALKHDVAVSEHLSEAVLLGMDLGLLDYLLQLEKQQRRQELAVNAITRAQARKQKAQTRVDAELD